MDDYLKDCEYVMSGYNSYRMVMDVVQSVLSETERTAVFSELECTGLGELEAWITEEPETTDWCACAIETRTPYFWAEGDLWRRPPE